MYLIHLLFTESLSEMVLRMRNGEKRLRHAKLHKELKPSGSSSYGVINPLDIFGSNYQYE